MTIVHRRYPQRATLSAHIRTPTLTPNGKSKWLRGHPMAFLMHPTVTLGLVYRNHIE